MSVKKRHKKYFNKYLWMWIYICEEHCESHSSFCGLWKFNLCKICKENHVHKIDQEIYDIKEELIEKNLKKNLSEISELKEYISVRLLFIYKYMKDFSFNNLFIRLSIWFQEKIKRKDIFNGSKFYFNTFFDEDFKKYHSNLIKYFYFWMKIWILSFIIINKRKL